MRRRAGIERVLASRADQRVLRWFGHVERMDDYSMARRVLMAKVSGGRVRGRLRLGWMDGVKVALGNRGMTVEAALGCAQLGIYVKNCATFLMETQYMKIMDQSSFERYYKYSRNNITLFKNTIN